MNRQVPLLEHCYATRALLVLLVLFSWSVLCEKELVEIHRVVSIGDVHGDAENFMKILRIADLIEGSSHNVSDVLTDPPKWKYTRTRNTSVKVHTTLVQLGDLIDRGEQDLESLNVAIGLQEQTRQSASEDKVVLLLGNHELQNIEGYYYYVNKNNYGGFLSKPLRVQAMRASGVFGKYIIDNFKTAHLEEGSLFVHAGLEVDTVIKDIDTMNDEIREALRSGNFRHPYLRNNGPLWTRKMVYDSMAGNCRDVEKILNRFEADRIVVGHTPQSKGRIEDYCDGKVYAADVGMSRWMYNKIAALEMVFLKYVDPETQARSSTYVIRELREGKASRFSAEDYIKHTDQRGSATAMTGDNDDNGDL